VTNESYQQLSFHNKSFAALQLVQYAWWLKSWMLDAWSWMPKKTFFKMLGGYPPAFLNAQKDIY
jgi:hypothetical protein